MEQERRYLRTRPAADYIGLGKSTLEKWRMTGDGPVYSSFGRVIVYARDDLDAFVLSKRRRSTADDGTVAA